MQEKPCILYIHVLSQACSTDTYEYSKNWAKFNYWETTLTKKIEFMKKLGAQKIQLLLATNINSGYSVFYPKMLRLEYA
jgi:hypothetical protein